MVSGTKWVKRGSFVFSLLKGLPCSSEACNKVIQLTREVVINPGCPCPLAGLVYKILRLWVPNPDQLNQDGVGRESVSIIPGSARPPEWAKACSGVCLWLLWESCSPLPQENGASAVHLHPQEEAASLPDLASKFQEELIGVVEEESVAHQGWWLPRQLRECQVTPWHAASCLSARCHRIARPGLPWAKVSLLKSVGDLSRFSYTQRKRQFAIE